MTKTVAAVEREREREREVFFTNIKKDNHIQESIAKKPKIFRFICYAFVLPRNNKRGITLIALVVTVIVLLILSGVSISMLTGQSRNNNKGSRSII